MIPPVIPATCRSFGEREIFDKLAQEEGTKDWIVLHSLDIAQHLRQVSGEADFVIIVPGLGVLCLEVKACHSLRCQEGLWYYGNDPKGDPRGPFKQASEAMHSIRKRVLQSDSSFARILFWSAVAFPFIEFKNASGEWHPWQIIDATRFKRQPIAPMISGVLRSARSHLSSQPTASWFRQGDHSPDTQQSAAIARLLRPSFEYIEKAPDRRARHQADVIRYTEEQFSALDMMEENHRVLFTGPAGTGKTVLALEAARRAASRGMKVLLVCFNRLLGRIFSNHTLHRDGLMVAGTLHQYMAGITGFKAPDGSGEAFWKIELPEAAAAKLLEGHNDTNRYDVVIADEIQDLLQSPYLDVLELVLKGGLKNGSWRMFGDFERQMLYGQNRDQIDKLINDRLGSFTKGMLRDNCRNTPRIATLSHLLGKLTPNYKRILRPDDRIEPVLCYYATPSQQRKEFAKTLEQLFKNSYSGEDIVVLSPKAGDRCIAANIADKPWSEQLEHYETAPAGKIRYTTIQSYKGLEAPAIVVTDIENVDSDMFSSLFYVATTRALERLYILVHETAKPGIVQALLTSNQN